jgi:hypothetical protein
MCGMGNNLCRSRIGIKYGLRRSHSRVPVAFTSLPFPIALALLPYGEETHGKAVPA